MEQEKHSPALFRRPAGYTPTFSPFTVDGMPFPAIPASRCRVQSNLSSSFASNGEGSAAFRVARENSAKLIFNTLSALDWIRSHLLLWFFLMSVLLAYFVPIPYIHLTGWLTNALVFVSLALTSANFPEFQRTMVVQHLLSISFVFFMVFVISPGLGVVLYWLIVGRIEGDHYLFLGQMDTMCLPASTVLAAFYTTEALGNEQLSRYLSTMTVVFGIIISPALMGCFSVLTEGSKLPSSNSALLFPATTIAPLALGYLAQRTFAWATRQRHDFEESPVRIHGGGKSVASSCSSIQAAGTELWEGSLCLWKKRCTQLNRAVMLLVSYIVFSSLFRQAINPMLTTWKAFAVLLVTGISMHSVLVSLTWWLTAWIADSPDDRIAIFFVAILKSEVLAIPVFFFIFHDGQHAAVALMPVLLYHCIQTISGSLLCSILRRWRNCVNCRPGTTLLPHRLSRTVRAPSV